MNRRAPRYPIGARIGRDLSVLSVVDDGGREPLYVVWHHGAWCPMVCKIFGSIGQLRREAAVLGSLRHPNVVRFLGTVSPASLLTEYLAGPSLRSLLAPMRPLTLSNVSRLGIHLAAALAHVHARGFVYLDMKPDNVIVARGQPMLVDFGTARPLRHADLRGHPEGTDAYMAPEQCRGGRVTPATDVFGLGVTLYEACAGRLPFPEARHRRDFPQLRTAAAPLRRVRRDTPPAFDTLVASCLALEPGDRPDVETVITSLHGFIRGGPPMWPRGFDPTRERRRRAA
jgi:eukaryotic-like serine/threonine-protein kinase